MFSADTCVPPLGSQTIETMEPSELEFPPESNAEGRAEAWCQLQQEGGGTCLLFSRVLMTCQVTL